MTTLSFSNNKMTTYSGHLKVIKRLTLLVNQDAQGNGQKRLKTRKKSLTQAKPLNILEKVPKDTLESERLPLQILKT